MLIKIIKGNLSGAIVEMHYTAAIKLIRSGEAKRYQNKMMKTEV